ncbi:MAG: hypothetical protein F9B45_01965 [Phycisphaera sp. RhM]|nr:hypothetical protein [Phycisphaera sp. RhM]
MTTEQGHFIEGRVAKTRLPFRVAAALLGVTFIAVAFFQVLERAENWIDFAFAIVVALMGVQFLYSALTGQRKSLFEWLSDGKVRQVSERFLMVEPVSCGTATLEASRQTRLPNQDVNPYAPPSDLAAASLADQVQAWSTSDATLHQLTEQFMAGYPFIHYGVVFFLDPDDDTSIHAALPLALRPVDSVDVLNSTTRSRQPDASARDAAWPLANAYGLESTDRSATDQLVRRNTEEAIRVLGEFLASLPDARAVVRGRNLVVRMISSYDRLDDEVAPSVVVPWSTIHARHVEG